MSRMNDRESAYGGCSDKEGMTLVRLQETRRKDNFDDNMKKFSSRALGVHGIELPKFSDNNKEYWKADKSYNPNPRQTSLTLLRTSQQYWKTPDPLTVNMVTNDPPPGDSFKKDFVMKKKKSEFTDKPNHVIHNDWKPREPNESPPPA
jgi:hypothetical protein